MIARTQGVAVCQGFAALLAPRREGGPAAEYGAGVDQRMSSSVARPSMACRYSRGRGPDPGVGPVCTTETLSADDAPVARFSAAARHSGQRRVHGCRSSPESPDGGGVNCARAQCCPAVRAERGHEPSAVQRLKTAPRPAGGEAAGGEPLLMWALRSPAGATSRGRSGRRRALRREARR